MRSTPNTAIAITAAVLGGACTVGGVDGEGGDGPAAHASIASASVACAGTARLEIHANGVELGEPHDGEVHDGHGHYHVYFHDDSGNPLVAGWASSVDVPIPASATPGTHELHVVLMHDDHTPIDGAAHGVVEVDVAATPCIAPSMADTTTVPGGTISVNVEVGNFTLEAPGGAPAEGHGHYHLAFDGDSETLATGYSTSILAEIPSTATPGEHALHLMLMNNDHTPVADAAHGVIAITVE